MLYICTQITTNKKNKMQTLIMELENKFTGELKITKQHSTNVLSFKDMFIKGTKTTKWLLGDWNLSRCYIETK